MKSIDKTAKSIGAFDSINYGVYSTGCNSERQLFMKLCLSLGYSAAKFLVPQILPHEDANATVCHER